MSLFTGNRLIGTPSQGAKENYGMNLEFTPIGAKRSSSSSNGNNNRSPLRSLNNEVNLPGRYAKTMEDIAESTFDNTLGDISTVHSFHNAQPTEGITTSYINRFFGRGHKHELVNNDSNPIKEQQMETQKLENENYNLKVKLATLTRYLDQTPEEQKELLNQNIDLKQKLMNAIKELQSLNDEKRKHYNEMGSNNNTQTLEDEIINLKSVLKEREQSLQQCYSQIRSLENNISNLEKDDKVNLLQKDLSNSNNELMFLRERIKSLQDNITRLEENNSDLKDRLTEVDRNDANFSEKVESLRDEVNGWQRKHEDVSKQLHRMQLVAERSKETYDLESSKYNRKTSEMEYELKNLRRELEEREKELRNALDKGGNQGNIVRMLEQKVDRLSADLKAKDSEEFNLRRQLDALLRSKSSTDDQRNQLLLSELNSFKEKEAHLRNKIADMESTKRKELEGKEALLNESKSQEAILQHTISSLKTQLESLKDQLYNSNSDVNSSTKQLDSLREKNFELEDKLRFFEKEYTLLENSNASLQHELDILKEQYKQADRSLSQSEAKAFNLMSEIQALKEDKSQKSALEELDQISRRSLESERNSLKQKVEFLEQEVKRQSEELKFERNKVKSSYDSGMYRNNLESILDEKNKLQNQLTDKILQINGLQDNISRLQSLLNEKDLQSRKFESRVQEMERATKSKSIAEQQEIDDLLRAKSVLDSKLKMSQLERENLEKDFKIQIERYQERITSLIEKQDESYLKNEKVESQKSMISLLEKQLEESSKSRMVLNDKVSDLTSENDRIKSKVQKLQKDNEQLLELTNQFEKNEKFAKLERGQLQENVHSLNKSLNKATLNCSKLAKKLQELKQLEKAAIISDAVKNKLSNRKLQDSNWEQKFQDLNSKFATTSFFDDQKQITRLHLLENELHYYKAKLHDMNLKSNDLEVMYSYVMNSIRSSDELFKSDLNKLSECGIYPDYPAMQLQKLNSGGCISFKVLAKLVLAAVRLRRRAQRAEHRKTTLHQLKKEIESDKINLLT